MKIRQLEQPVYDLMRNMRVKERIEERIKYISVEDGVFEFAQSGQHGGNIVYGIKEIIERS